MTFLGSASYNRRFVPNYAKIVTPLVALLPKKKNFSWDAEQQEGYERIKVALTRPSLLAFPDEEQVQILSTNASTLGIAAALSVAGRIYRWRDGDSLWFSCSSWS